MLQPLKSWLFRSRILLAKIVVRPVFTGLTFLILFCQFSNAQVNLVPNPSFENYTNCPNWGGQIYYAYPWYDALNPVPVNGSTEVEYYNACGTGYYDVPYQDTLNFQEANDGVAFAGIYTYNWPGNNYREYLQVKLNDTLASNACYYIEFFANVPYGGQGYATNNLGCVLSDTAISTISIGTVIDAIPNILLHGNPVIKDTLGWVRVSGMYTAFGNETYLTIGNFYPDATTDTTVIFYSSYPAAYYFIDDVKVIEISEPAWTYSDTSIIIGDSVFIGNLMSGLNCTWYLNDSAISNAPGFYVSPSVNSDYIIEMNICGNFFYDTVTVIVEPNTVQAKFQLKEEAKIYPNPAAGEFTIELPQEKTGDWLIVLKDAEGRKIFERLIQHGQPFSKVTTAAQSGIYMVHITNTLTNATTIKKLVIQK